MPGLVACCFFFKGKMARFGSSSPPICLFHLSGYAITPRDFRRCGYTRGIPFLRQTHLIFLASSQFTFCYFRCCHLIDHRISNFGIYIYLCTTAVVYLWCALHLDLQGLVELLHLSAVLTVSACPGLFLHTSFVDSIHLQRLCW